MFVATPVRAESSRVIAAMAVRFDPAQDFARLCHLGRMGRTGETYTFDEDGPLLSESRFDESLVVRASAK